MTVHRRFRLACLALVVACNGESLGGPGIGSSAPSLDAQVRQQIERWGVLPILPVKAQDPALVDLGRSLFFDKVLSGNRDVACASCHNPLTHLGDGQSLAVGTGGLTVGGARMLGAGRQFTPRNAPSLFNSPLGAFYMFWDGRVSGGPPGPFQTPAGLVLPGGLSGLPAAQAMIPVTNRVEMRGSPGDRDAFGNVNELAQFADTDNTAIWGAEMKRVLAISSYLLKFNAAFPGVPVGQLGFQDAANAIAAFEGQAFAKTNSPFDRYLARDDNALATDAKKGALLFFGKAQCASCHGGPLLGGVAITNAGVPQLGPGAGRLAPLDIGRDDAGQGRQPVPAFLFRAPPLRNVELTAPYMHDGVYATLEEVVRHYNNVDSALKAFDPTSLDPSVRAGYHGDPATIAMVSATLDGRLRFPLALTAEEQRQLVVFLKSLTDPSARDMGGIVPAAVPSGLTVPR